MCIFLFSLKKYLKNVNICVKVHKKYVIINKSQFKVYAITIKSPISLR